MNKYDFQNLLIIYQSIKDHELKKATKEYEDLISNYLETFPDINEELEKKINKIYNSSKYKNVNDSFEKLMLILEDIEESKILPKLYKLVKNENVSFSIDEEEYSIRNIQFVNKA